MEAAVTTVLADFFGLQRGTCLETGELGRASNRAGGPLLRPQAVPTAAGISGSRRWLLIHNLVFKFFVSWRLQLVKTKNPPPRRTVGDTVYLIYEGELDDVT